MLQNIIQWSFFIKINMGRRWLLLQILGTIKIIILLLSALVAGAIQIMAVDELIYFIKRYIT
jgi:hypothetical protein